MLIYRKLVALLAEKNLKMSTAESVSGGKIISSIIEIPGASNITEQSYIVYSNDAKIKVLGLKKETIDTYGVVSEEVALEMARNLKKISNSNIAISTTGEAGPILNDLNIAQGTVCFGLIIDDKEYTYTKVFLGDRLDVIESSVIFILDTLFKLLK